MGVGTRAAWGHVTVGKSGAKPPAEAPKLKSVGAGAIAACGLGGRRVRATKAGSRGAARRPLPFLRPASAQPWRSRARPRPGHTPESERRLRRHQGAGRRAAAVVPVVAAGGGAAHCSAVRAAEPGAWVSASQGFLKGEEKWLGLRASSEPRTSSDLTRACLPQSSCLPADPSSYHGCRAAIAALRLRRHTAGPPLRLPRLQRRRRLPAARRRHFCDGALRVRRELTHW